MIHPDYTEEQIKQMDDDDTYYDTLNNLWRNYCISDTYEPGSTAKSLTLATGLETDPVGMLKAMEKAWKKNELSEKDGDKAYIVLDMDCKPEKIQLVKLYMFHILGIIILLFQTFVKF